MNINVFIFNTDDQISQFLEGLRWPLYISHGAYFNLNGLSSRF